jgi:hypothetical protein
MLITYFLSFNKSTPIENEDMTAFSCKVGSSSHLLLQSEDHM